MQRAFASRSIENDGELVFGDQGCAVRRWRRCCVACRYPIVMRRVPGGDSPERRRYGRSQPLVMASVMIASIVSPKAGEASAIRPVAARSVGSSTS